MIHSILIYGAGSIGSLFAGKLSSLGQEVVIIGREPHVSVCDQNGITIHEVYNNKSFTTAPIKGSTSIYELQQETELDPDVILISCKAYRNEYAAEDLQQLYRSDGSTKLVLLQNGVGNEEIFYEYYPKKSVYRIITSEGARLVAPGNVLHAGHGTTFIGCPAKSSPDNFSKEFTALLTTAGFKTFSSPHINQDIWTKCLINAPINPIATINKVKNGELIKQPNLRSQVIKVIEETINVFKKRNILITNTDPIELVLSVAKNTSENKCSMLQDIEHGRQTEIDFLNGWILREANLANITAPFNFSLYSQIKQIELASFTQRLPQ